MSERVCVAQRPACVCGCHLRALVCTDRLGACALHPCRLGPEFLERCTRDSVAASMTLQQFLDEYGFSAAFRNWYLIPHAAAVWSASNAEVMLFPAATFIQFFVNHSLLQVRGCVCACAAAFKGRWGAKHA